MPKLSDLLTSAAAVRNESAAEQNTALRVGNVLYFLTQYLQQYTSVADISMKVSAVGVTITAKSQTSDTTLFDKTIALPVASSEQAGILTAEAFAAITADIAELQEAFTDLFNEKEEIATRVNANAENIAALDSSLQASQRAIANLSSTLDAAKTEISDNAGNISSLSALLDETKEIADTATRILPFDGLVSNPTIEEMQGTTDYDSIVFDRTRGMFLAKKAGKYYNAFPGAEHYNKNLKARTDRLFIQTATQLVYIVEGTTLRPFILSEAEKTKLGNYPNTPQEIPTANEAESGLMSAEDKTKITELEDEIYGSTEIIPVSLSKTIEEKGYFNFGRVNVGDKFNYISSPSYSSSMEKFDAITVPIKSGTRFYLQGYNDGSYLRIVLYIIVSKSNVVLAKAESRAYQQDEKSDIFEFDEDCRVFMNVQNSSDENCGAFELVEVVHKGLKQEIDELKDSGARLPLIGKTIVTIGDSLCTSGIWQNKVCEITGASFDSAKNVDPSHPLSVGGTSMYGTKKDMGLVRVMNIKKLGIDPDIILLENVNDKSAFYVNSGTPLAKRAGELTDKPYIISQVIDDVASVDDWSTNASSILSNIPQDKRKFGTMLMLTNFANGINIKVTTLPTSDGTFTLSLLHAGQTNTYGITVSAGESADSIIRKILEYDYQNVSDTLADDGISVNFVEEAGVSLRVQYSSNETGIVLSITDTSAAKTQSGVFFDGDSLSDWTDASKWIDIVPLYRAWKGVIEYCNINFPTAKIYICAMINRSGKTSNDYNLPNGTYDQESYLSYLARENALVNALKDIAKMYSIPIIDVGHMDGINISNLDTFYPTPNAHPYVNCYERWGEVIAKEII